MNGPHTRVRVDAVATPSAATSPQGKRRARGGRQMGLTSFYRGMSCPRCFAFFREERSGMQVGKTHALPAPACTGSSVTTAVSARSQAPSGA
jgi:hypothetical protein